ncbi:hypothetical protein TNCV_708541 [Trichonephila clavipes]|nr:hypothetical protein TNCV_708541 [Trichonephila clavipes]
MNLKSTLPNSHHSGPVSLHTRATIAQQENPPSRRPIILPRSNSWLATLTDVLLDLGLNPGEEMAVCNCIVPSSHGGTLNSRRAASPLEGWWMG